MREEIIKMKEINCEETTQRYYDVNKHVKRQCGKDKNKYLNDICRGIEQNKNSKRHVSQDWTDNKTLDNIYELREKIGKYYVEKMK